MKILAIDPGYDRIGIAVLDKGPHTDFKEILITSTCYRTNKERALSDRILEAADIIISHIHTYKPQACAIEQLFFTNNQKTALGVAEAKGVFGYLARKEGIPLYEYTPLQIKTAITGDGSAPKEYIARMIPKLLHLDIEELVTKRGGTSHGIDDELDAIAIGLTCYAYEAYLGASK